MVAVNLGKVALFLVSDMASYMTGTQVVVDGGALLTWVAADLGGG